MIEQRKLKELVKLMVANDLTELDLQDETERVTLKRSVPGGQVQVVPQAAAPAPGSAAPAPAPAPAAPSPAATDAEPARDPNLVAITSPMIGTFYSAASPDADAFVSVGSSVDHESVVCIVEAMKVFNEIKAETKGKIEKILVENGQAVEFGQELFLVKPN